MLGAVCVLVKRTARGFCAVSRVEAAAIQRAAYASPRRPDWLFDQCCRISEALNDNQIALAQIYGVHAAPDDLDDHQVAKLADAEVFFKANFNPDEPRVPAGNPDGGQWTTDGSNSEERNRERKAKCIEQCNYLLLRPLPYRWSDLNRNAFLRCIDDCMREMA